MLAMYLWVILAHDLLTNQRIEQQIEYLVIPDLGFHHCDGMRANDLVVESDQIKSH